ncbi:MAG: cupin domain-containing protein [Deltaproteobacteria bacterium]|nr:cupin domain-containing protein [Deltaproteobacteria bacterium]MBI3388109.1 cupin domain-containing protein [Deltaproteobacteria bacterium]
MAKRSLSEQLDDAVTATMANQSDTSLAAVTPRIASLLRIAGELHDLPRETFKARLKAELLSTVHGTGEGAAAVPSYGKPLVTEDDIYARLEELAAAPKFVAHDVAAALSDLPEMTMRFLAQLNQCTIGVSRGSTPSHWERHPGGDELLYFLAGEADVVTLADGGPIHSTVRAGSVFICPQGLWHQLRPRSPVSMLFATPGEGTQASAAEDPRLEPGGKGRVRAPRQSAGRGRRAKDPTLVAHDVDGALSDLPERAWRELASLNQCVVGLFRFSGQSPWERHPGGDELLHALDGEVDVTVLTNDGPVHTSVRAGSVFVCPKGLWHRQNAPRGVTHLYATPRQGNEHSWAQDPRHES